MEKIQAPTPGVPLFAISSDEDSLGIHVAWFVKENKDGTYRVRNVKTGEEWNESSETCAPTMKHAMLIYIVSKAAEMSALIEDGFLDNKKIDNMDQQVESISSQIVHTVATCFASDKYYWKRWWKKFLDRSRDDK